MAEDAEDRTPAGQGHARAGPGNRSVLPGHLVRFLRLLEHNGNVSMSARLIGWSRSTVYAFAARNPSFKEAMREAMTEARELLVGEGWRRAYNWSEYTDTAEEVHVRPPSDRLLAILIQGYFQQFKPGRDEDQPGDELIPATADLTVLSDDELEALEALLVKVGGDELGSRES